MIDEWECDQCETILLSEKDYDIHIETHVEKK